MIPFFCGLAAGQVVMYIGHQWNEDNRGDINAK
jgi:hypothetical protein